MQEVFDVSDYDRALLGVEQGHFISHNIDGHFFIMLGQQHGVDRAYEAGAGDGNFHVYSTLTLTL